MSLCKNDLVIFNRDEMNILNVIMSIISYLSIQANKNKRPLIILGPSGVGKDTIINMLLKKYPDIFYKLPSYTTRPKRKGEKEGVDYFYITKEEFQVKRNQNKIIGIQEYNGNFYASDKSKLNELMIKGEKIIILNYNIETANKVKDELDFNFIAILPPCEDELRNRLKSRGTNPEELEKRMQNSLREKKLINEANYIQFRVVNDEKDICLTKVENHIKELYPNYFRSI
jgi:guanylate kinase